MIIEVTGVVLITIVPTLGRMVVVVDSIIHVSEVTLTGIIQIEWTIIEFQDLDREATNVEIEEGIRDLVLEVMIARGIAIDQNLNLVREVEIETGIPGLNQDLEVQTAKTTETKDREPSLDLAVKNQKREEILNQDLGLAATIAERKLVGLDLNLDQAGKKRNGDQNQGPEVVAKVNVKSRGILQTLNQNIKRNQS